MTSRPITIHHRPFKVIDFEDTVEVVGHASSDESEGDDADLADFVTEYADSIESDTTTAHRLMDSQEVMDILDTVIEDTDTSDDDSEHDEKWDAFFTDILVPEPPPASNGDGFSLDSDQYCEKWDGFFVNTPTDIQPDPVTETPHHPQEYDSDATVIDDTPQTSPTRTPPQSPQDDSMLEDCLGDILIDTIDNNTVTQADSFEPDDYSTDEDEAVAIISDSETEEVVQPRSHTAKASHAILNTAPSEAIRRSTRNRRQSAKVVLMHSEQASPGEVEARARASRTELEMTDPLEALSKACISCSYSKFKGNRNCNCRNWDTSTNAPKLEECITSGKFEDTLQEVLDYIPARARTIINSCAALCVIHQNFEATNGYSVVYNGSVAAVGRRLQSAMPLLKGTAHVSPPIHDNYRADVDNLLPRVVKHLEENVECYKTAIAMFTKALAATREADVMTSAASEISLRFITSRSVTNNPQVDLAIAMPSTVTFPHNAIGSMKTIRSNDDRLQWTKYTRSDDPNAAVMIFPCLFPDGIGFSSEFRRHMKRGSLRTWVRTLMYAGKSQSVFKTKGISVTFIAIIHTMLMRLEALQYSLCLKYHADQERHRITTTQTDVYKGIPTKIDTRLVIPPKAVGSDNYFRSRTRHLMSLVASFGLPHFFWTFTVDPAWLRSAVNDAAESPKVGHFSRKSSPYSLGEATSIEIQLIRWYFVAITSSIRKQFKAKGKGKRTIFFTRVEEQGNGLPHMHVFTWHADVSRTNQTYTSAIDEVCSTDAATLDDESRKRQTHEHIEAICGGERCCSLQYPEPARESSSIDADEFKLKRKYEDRYTVPFCPAISKYLKGQMHVQPVASNMFIGYLTKYVVKSRNQTVTDTEAGEFTQYAKTQRSGWQMMAWRIMGLPLIESNVGWMDLPIHQIPEYRTYSPFHGFARARVGAIEKYYNRPAKANKLTIIEFYQQYRVERLPDTASTFSFEMKVSALDKDDSNIMIFKYKVVKRTRKLPIFTRVLTPADGDQYYHSILMRNGNYRSDREVLGIHDSYARACVDQNFITGIASKRKDFLCDIPYIMNFNKDMNEEGQLAIIDAAVKKQYKPGAILRSIAMVKDEAVKKRLASHVRMVNDIATLDLATIKRVWQRPMSLDISHTLGISQNRVLDAFFRDMNAGRQSIFIVTGAAGCGKSILINHVARHTAAVGYLALISASTNIAANLIQGVTIHSLLKYNGKFNAPPDGSPESHLLKACKVLIIDEAFMLSAADIGDINTALSICMKSEESFGGLSIIFVGDPFQLPPVTKDMAEPLKSAIHYDWAQRDAKFFELTENYRHVSDRAFMEILKPIANATNQWINYAALASRALLTDENTLIEFLTNYDKAVLISPTWARCSRVNSLAVHSTANASKNKIFMFKTYVLTPTEAAPDIVSHPLFSCPVMDVTESSRNAGSESFTNRLEDIPLTIGARVILNITVCKEAGIVNGTRGTVVELDKDVVGVSFMVNGKQTFYPIRHVTVETQGMFHHFMPLSLAYAMTVHRVQGQTLDKIIVDFTKTSDHDGPAFWEPGQLYTALSRVHKLDDLFLFNLTLQSHWESQESSTYPKSPYNPKSVVETLETHVISADLLRLRSQDDLIARIAELRELTPPRLAVNVQAPRPMAQQAPIHDYMNGSGYPNSAIPTTLPRPPQQDAQADDTDRLVQGTWDRFLHMYNNYTQSTSGQTRVLGLQIDSVLAASKDTQDTHMVNFDTNRPPPVIPVPVFTIDDSSLAKKRTKAVLSEALRRVTTRRSGQSKRRRTDPNEGITWLPDDNDASISDDADISDDEDSHYVSMRSKWENRSDILLNYKDEIETIAGETINLNDILTVRSKLQGIVAMDDDGLFPASDGVQKTNWTQTLSSLKRELKSKDRGAIKSSKRALQDILTQRETLFREFMSDVKQKAEFIICSKITSHKIGNITDEVVPVQQAQSTFTTPANVFQFSSQSPVVAVKRPPARVRIQNRSTLAPRTSTRRRIVHTTGAYAEINAQYTDNAGNGNCALFALGHLFPGNTTLTGNGDDIRTNVRNIAGRLSGNSNWKRRRNIKKLIEGNPSWDAVVAKFEGDRYLNVETTWAILTSDVKTGYGDHIVVYTYGNDNRLRRVETSRSTGTVPVFKQSISHVKAVYDEGILFRFHGHDSLANHYMHVSPIKAMSAEEAKLDETITANPEHIMLV